MHRIVTRLVLVAFWGLWALVPLWAEPEARVTDPLTPQESDGAAAEDREEPAAEDPERAEYPEYTFQLYSRRDVDLRARPDVGLRVPPAQPIFSPHSADFYDRGREHELPLYSVAAAFTLFATDGERDSAKAQEFRDLNEDGAVGLDAQLRTDDVWFRVTGRHLLLDDQDVRLELRRFGAFSAKLDYSQIPHNYAFDATSIYSGVGSGVLEIDDTTQQFLQDSTSLVDAADRLQEVVAGASRVDLGHRRDRTAFELDFTAFDPLAVELTVKHESRKGTRPWSASFGLASVVEIPWPVDYDTREVRLGVEYKLPKTLISAAYRVSEFDNDISTVAFDNPWRITDSARFSRVPYSEGPAAGLIDLYPSNSQDELTFTFVRSQLPGKSSFAATASWGQLEQDDALVPFTTNTAIVPGAPGNPPFDASDPSSLPALSADAEMNTRLIHLRWTAQPTQRLRIKAHLRDYELDNQTAQIFIPGLAPEDAYWRPFGTPEGRFTNLPIAQSKTEVGLDFTFHLAKGTRLTLGYENEEIDREFREVEKSDEDRFEISLDVKPAPWLDLKASYLFGERRAEEYDFAQFFRNQGINFIPVLSFLRKFDQANRDRDRLQVIANFYPTEKLTVGGQVIVGEDDYPDSRFGVLDDKHEIYAVDVGWAASERLSLFASYSLESYEVSIAGREWIAFGPGDPFRTEPDLESPSNWSADTEDDVDSIAFGLDVALIPDKLHLDVSYTYSKSDGRIAYASPIGEVDNSPFELADFEQVDDVTWYNVNPELEYSIGERLSLTLAYMRERYEILDFNQDGFELVPTTVDGELNGGLFMGTFPADFDVDVVYLTLKVDF